MERIALQQLSSLSDYVFKYLYESNIPNSKTERKRNIQIILDIHEKQEIDIDTLCKISSNILEDMYLDLKDK